MVQSSKWTFKVNAPPAQELRGLETGLYSCGFFFPYTKQDIPAMTPNWSLWACQYCAKIHALVLLHHKGVILCRKRFMAAVILTPNPPIWRWFSHDGNAAWRPIEVAKNMLFWRDVHSTKPDITATEAGLNHHKMQRLLLVWFLLMYVNFLRCYV